MSGDIASQAINQMSEISLTETALKINPNDLNHQNINQNSISHFNNALSALRDNPQVAGNIKINWNNNAVLRAGEQVAAQWNEAHQIKRVEDITTLSGILKLQKNVLAASAMVDIAGKVTSKFVQNINELVRTQ